MTAEPDLYFGRPGSLELIPHPRGGVTSTRIRQRSRFDTAAGGARVSQIVGGKRQIALSWERLYYADFATLLAYDQGHQGPGPFALIDPAATNMLTVNQSAATAETGDTSNFTISGSGNSLATTTTVTDRGPNALVSNLTLGASGVLSLSTPSTQWTGCPVVPILTYRFWLTAKGGGSDAIMSVTPRLIWYDALGAFISTSLGTPVTTSSGVWTVGYVDAAAPSTAAFVLCSATFTGASTGSILYFGRFQLQLQPSGAAAPVAADWRPGTAVVPVAVLSLVEAWPWQATGYRERPVLTLQEVGP